MMETDEEDKYHNQFRLKIINVIKYELIEYFIYIYNIMYHKILNPESGRKVSIYGKIGQKILRNYINHLNGGGPHGGIPSGSECTGVYGFGTRCGYKKGTGKEMSCLKIDSKASSLKAKKPHEKVNSGEKGVCGLL